MANKMLLRTKFKCGNRLKDSATWQSYSLFREDHKIFEPERNKLRVQPTSSAVEQTDSPRSHGSRQSLHRRVRGAWCGISSPGFKSHPTFPPTHDLSLDHPLLLPVHSSQVVQLMAVRWGLDNAIPNFVSRWTTNFNLVKSVRMSEVYPHKDTLLYVLCCNESYANKPYFREHGEQKNKRYILQWNTPCTKKKQTSTSKQLGCQGN